ncbi:hypothetical protein IFR05_012160 [Cadophora sp. M221]|nr:hypothetical protein IFR05_012160 [Cadophora sp. M221]
MSLGFALTDTTSSSSDVSDVATADLPRICDDLECLYPFGPACDICSFKLDMKARGKQRVCTPEKIGYLAEAIDEWVEELRINRYIAVYVGEKFTGGADETDGPVSDTKEREEEEEEEEEKVEEEEVYEEYSDADDAGSEYELVADSVMNDDDYDADMDVISASTLSTLTLAAPLCGTSSKSSSSWTASSSTASLADAPESQLLSPWLDAIFDNTLQGQMDEVHFTGGADVEKEPYEETCLICGKPLGEATDQHYLKCKYAHEEIERWGTSWETGRTKRGRVHW